MCRAVVARMAQTQQPALQRLEVTVQQPIQAVGARAVVVAVLRYLHLLPVAMVATAAPAVVAVVVVVSA
jgi:hypothetical protein